MSNAEKQAALRERRAKAGLVLFQAWVTPAQAAMLKALLQGRDNAATPPVTYNSPPALTGQPRGGRKRSRKRDPVRERNQEVVRQHQAELAARARAGQKPSALAEWLHQFGFVGGGATLNGLWRP